MCLGPSTNFLVDGYLGTGNESHLSITQTKKSPRLSAGKKIRIRKERSQRRLDNVKNL